jgi:hypothetical protein
MQIPGRSCGCFSCSKRRWCSYKPLIQLLHSFMSLRWMRLPVRLLLVLIAPKESCFWCSYLATRAAAFRAAKGAGTALTEGKRQLVRPLLVHPVVLSRVRTLAWLFLENPIPNDIEFGRDTIGIVIIDHAIVFASPFFLRRSRTLYEQRRAVRRLRPRSCHLLNARLHSLSPLLLE